MDAAEIIQLLEKPTKGSRWPFVYQIRDEAAVPDIIAALQASTNPFTCYLLCYVLNARARAEFFERKSTETQRAAIPALTEALTDLDERVRDAARDALDHLAFVTMSQQSEQKIERLIAQLEGTEREPTAVALGELVDERTLTPLLALLQHEQGEVRHVAALALAYMGEGRDTDWFVRAHREQVQQPLIQALHDPESQVRAAVARALDQWGDERAVEPLLGIIQDEDAEVRRQVVEAIGYPKDERALEPLLHAFFTDQDAMVRAYATQGLGLFEDRRAVDALVQDLQDEQAHIRRGAAEMLSWLKDERAADALIQALQDSDQEVREWAMEALWWLCCDKGDALPSATEEKIRQSLPLALQDESSEVRESAAKIADWLD